MSRLRPLLPWPVLAYAGLAAVYVALRVTAFSGWSPVTTLIDTQSYLRVAGHSLFSLDFWAGERAWTVPLLYKLLPDSTDWRTGAQLTVSLLAWTTLAGVVAWCVRGRVLRLVAFAAVLLFSLSLPVIEWDTLVISESFSLSLGALTLAAWLGLARRPNPWTIAAVLATMTLFVFARDTNAYVALMTLPLLLAWVLRPGPRRGRLVLLAGMALLFVASVASTNVGDDPRWRAAMIHVLERRVLRTPHATVYFRDHGMPAGPQVQALAAVPDDGAERVQSRRTHPVRPPEYERWVRENSRRTLVTYLLTHPYRAVVQPWDDRERILGAHYLRNYRSPEAEPLLPTPLRQVAYPGDPRAALILALVIGLAAAGVARWAGARPVWLVPATALAMQPVVAFVAWHGDTGEIARHTLPVAVFARLGLLILLLFAADALLARRRERSRGGTESRQAPRRAKPVPAA